MPEFSSAVTPYLRGVWLEEQSAVNGDEYATCRVFYTMELLHVIAIRRYSDPPGLEGSGHEQSGFNRRHSAHDEWCRPWSDEQENNSIFAFCQESNLCRNREEQMLANVKEELHSRGV